MTPVFEHIEQTKYLLRQLLESGFLSGRGFDEDLSRCQEAALALGLPTGGELLGRLSASLTELRAGQGNFANSSFVYSALNAYYDYVTNQLILETI